MHHEMLIYLVLLDMNSTRLGLNLYSELEKYINDNYICEKELERYKNRLFSSSTNIDGFSQYKKESDKSEKTLKNKIPNISVISSIIPETSDEMNNSNVYKSFELSENEHRLADLRENDYKNKEMDLEERIKHLSDTFQEHLFYIIKQKNFSNAEVYRNSLITKQTFSKIKRNKAYHPDKFTTMRLCVGLKLNLDESKDLLARAGYALSSCDKRDIIFSFFIENEIYDIYEVDIALEKYDLPCLIN